MGRIALILLSGCGQSERPAPDNVSQTTAVEPARVETNAAAPAETGNACLIQVGKRIPENRLHAIGTEPFWGADVEGRCVTYSTPEDQKGTRVWTRFSEKSGERTWSGALDGQPFLMVARNGPACSDGMSDTIYPVAVSLTVRGETRTGCAEPR